MCNLRFAALAASLAALLASVVPSSVRAGLLQDLQNSYKTSQAARVAQIDHLCDAAQRSAKSMSPLHLELRGRAWRAVPGTDARLEAHGAAAAALVWRPASYTLVRQRNFGGGIAATALCFRPDGSLARARQADSLGELDGSDTVGYYDPHGTLIWHDPDFSDKGLIKRRRDLPFAGQLR